MCIGICGLWYVVNVYIPGAACAAEEAKLKENGLGDDDAAGWPNMVADGLQN